LKKKEKKMQKKKKKKEKKKKASFPLSWMEAVKKRCLRCKEGHRKCDGKTPTCTRCKRMEVDCFYNAAPPSPAEDDVMILVCPCSGYPSLMPSRADCPVCGSPAANRVTRDGFLWRSRSHHWAREEEEEEEEKHLDMSVPQGLVLLPSPERINDPLRSPVAFGRHLMHTGGFESAFGITHERFLEIMLGNVDAMKLGWGMRRMHIQATLQRNPHLQIVRFRQGMSIMVVDRER
jgi:hypothetical protein